jgi:hypothetical protein
MRMNGFVVSKRFLGNSRRSRLLLAGVLIPITFGLFSLFVWTAGFGLAWHLLHGKSTTLKGQKIQVPWDMFVLHSEDERTLELLRLAAPFPILKSPAGLIFISLGPAKLKPNLERLARAFAQPPKGCSLKAVRKINLGTGTVTCWEHVNTDSSWLYIDCISGNAILNGSFSGNPKYWNAFYGAIESASNGAVTQR